MFLNQRGVADENQVLAGKLGVMQAIMAGIDCHATIAQVAEHGLCALSTICANGSPMTEYAQLQEQ